MKTVYITASIVALATFPAFAGSYDHATSDPVVRPAAAPEDAAGCRMRLIPGTNVWQKADPYCIELPFTSPDPQEPDHPGDEIECAVVAGPPENDAKPGPC